MDPFRFPEDYLMVSRTARLAAGAVLATIVATLACAPDAAVAPRRSTAIAHRPTSNVLPETLPVDVSVLRRKWRLRANVTWTFTVDQNGTVVNNSQLGLHIRFPRGAVSAPTTITVLAPAGPFVAYDFSPHGLVFNRTVWVRQRLPNTLIPTDSTLQAAYYGTGLPVIDPLIGVVTVSEFEPTTIEAAGAVARFGITHFSGYVVATGRR